MTSEPVVYSEGISEDLLQAVSKGQVENVREIIDNQCLLTNCLCRLLHYTASCGQVEVARLLINEYKCPVDCRNDSKQTPLHLACYQGHLNVVRMLATEHKADLNVCDKDNDIPLNKATLGGHTNVVKTLIDVFNCSPLTKGFRGRTLVHHACDSGNVELVEMVLTKYNLNPLSVDDNGNTPLHIAALAGREEVANMLITKYKCPVDYRNNSKQTPLHLACIKGHLNVVRMLASEHKADLNARDKDNNMPLNKAAFGEQTDIVMTLIDEFNCSPMAKGLNGRTIVHQVCNSGKVELVEMLLTKYDLDSLPVDDDGVTPLHIAALAGREEVANMLIAKYKCPVDCRNNSKQTPLHLACHKGHLNVVMMLVTEHKADLTARDIDNNMPLNKAAFGGQTDIVMTLIDKFKCSPMAKGWNGRTIVHQACNSGKVELVEMLLTKYNLDPLPVDDGGDTPLHIAALAGREEVANMLITKYKCPVDCRNNSKQTPLHYACYKGHLNVVRMLVTEHKADLTARDKDDNMPLNKAAFGGQTDIVMTLIDEFNCSPMAKGLNGRTIVHQACGSGKVELVEMLLTKYNLDPLPVDKDGDTPLHIAALAGREEVANMLITKYKCPVDCRNNSKQTPLHFVCHKGHLNVVRMLVSEHKADLNARDKDNNTPLNIAVRGGHANVVKALIDEFNCNALMKGFKSRSLLHQACQKDHEELVRLLIDYYELSLLSTDKDGHTPLHISAIYGSAKCLHILLHSYNAPVFIRNNAGRTAVSVAKDVSIKQILDIYVQNKHKSIIYDYKEVQALSVNKYSGAQNITRIFVIGNIESGKSTLIESLKREGFVSSLSSVSEATVPPHTSGIIPSVHYSKTIGRVLYYDFAGDPEYYSSHSAIISNVMQSKIGTNIFLVVVNLKKDLQTIHTELGHWFNFVLYHTRYQSKRCKILVIGSHADGVTRRASRSKVLSMSQFLLKYIFEITEVTFEIIDILTLNCRKPRSSKYVLDTLAETIIKEPKCSLSNETAILLGLLEKDFKEVVTCKLQTLISHIEDTGIHLPNTATSLYPFVEELHTVGLLMTIRTEGGKLEDCLLLLGISKLTNKVHKLLFSGSELPNDDNNSHGASTGILPHTYLRKILPDYISIDCLVQLQYCQEFSNAEVKFDHLIVPTENPSSPRLLYFPALCTAETKNNIITTDDYTYSIGWFADCHGKFDYFPSRYSHVLLLRLAFSFAHPVAPCAAEGESEHVVDVMKSNCKCTMWKNGIHWHMEEGVECIVELVNNSKSLVVVTKSRVEEERKSKCTEILFKIIDLAVQAKEEFCHSITLKQYLMPLDPKDTSSFRDYDNLFDLRDIERVLRERKPVALSTTRKKKVESFSLAHLKVHLLTGSTSQQKAASSQPSIVETSTKSILHDTDHPTLYKKLKEHSYKWKEIGTLLGFRLGELDNIEARPLLLSGAPKSWLSAMLAEWLEWAPEDARGSTDFATLDGLRQALDKSGLSATAQALQ